MATERIPETTGPRIYVASLADYNAGRLHGKWIDADQDADAIQTEVNAMLAESKEPIAEEWAIHDYELGGIQIGEWESFEKISTWATGIAEHGPAYAAWVANAPDYNIESDDFLEAYAGEFHSLSDFTTEIYDGMYSETELGPLAMYIDWDAVGRDLMIGDYFEINGFYFRNN